MEDSIRNPSGYKEAGQSLNVSLSGREERLGSLDDFCTTQKANDSEAGASSLGGEWAQAAVVTSASPVPSSYTSGAWPEAAEVVTSRGRGQSASSSTLEQKATSSNSPPKFRLLATAEALSAPSTSSYSRAEPSPEAGAQVSETSAGLQRFVAELTKQLAEEVRRRNLEEAELERRAAEKRKLLEDLDALRTKRESVEAERRDEERAASEVERQHAELAEEHRSLRLEVARQEEQLEKMREEAKARHGSGRDWARDGPEKDALVETKLRIAEAHDEFAQLRQQLSLNREGLRKQLSQLQIENARLKATGKIIA